MTQCRTGQQHLVSVSSEKFCWQENSEPVFSSQPEMVAKGGHQGGQKVAKKMAKIGLKMAKDEHSEDAEELPFFCINPSGIAL